MCLHEILFEIDKNFYRDFSDVEARLWRGLFKLYTMLRMVPFQIGQNVHRRRSQNWKAFHVNER
jgi:hypothetical protein